MRHRRCKVNGAKEKAALARSLIEELDEAPDEDVEEVWAEEAERRYQAFVDGFAEAVPADDVIARAKQRFKSGKSELIADNGTFQGMSLFWR